MKVTLRHVRYYDQHIHPDAIKRWGGFRSWWVLVLNTLRWWIETRVQKHVMLLLAKQTEMDPRKKLALLAAFWDDVRAEDRALRAEDPERVAEIPRAMRYSGGRTGKVAVDAEELPTRPRPLDQMAERYGAVGRAKRYALKDVRLVVDEFEGVERPPEEGG